MGNHRLFRADHGAGIIRREELPREASPSSTGETMDNYRQFTGEELIIKAMRKRETEVGHDVRLPIPEAEWLASLRKGAKVQMIKRPQ
jgi:hypothetical protein